MKHLSLALCLAPVTLTACLADDPEGLAKAPPAATTVKYDFLHRPLPEIPLPNDIATRHDATSPTGRRINASLIAPSGFERSTRALIDEVDGWGVYQAISIPFTGPLDVQSILDGHRDADYAPENDVVLLVNVDRDSAGFGEHIPLDVGNGNHPVVLEQIEGYWKNDPRGFSLSLFSTRRTKTQTATAGSTRAKTRTPTACSTARTTCRAPRRPATTSPGAPMP
jgi:hypothetical protein